MDKVIIFTNPDQTIEIVKPNWKRRMVGESEEEFLHRVAKTDVPERAISYRVGSLSEQPPSREKRTLWRDNGTKIVIAEE